ncbi:MAG: T9SS type A sorting domain-containing protein [Chitinophagaceae bacterium]|nr:T9SS type A sorting domain-containing protein [Chitinophagaceae bacterium]
MKQNLPFVTFSFGLTRRIFRRTLISKMVAFASLFLLLQPAARSQGSGSAVQFDGVDDYALISTLSFNSSYTKEAWVFFTGTNATFYNIVSGQNTAFWVNGGFLSGGHLATGFTQIQDPTPFPTNVWTHVALTYDAGVNELRLYKNGILVAGPVTPGAFAEGQQQIGAYFDGTFYIFPWLGAMDEVRIWDVALTQAEIRDYICSKVTNTHPQYANLVGYYKADEGSGATLGDDLGINDASLVNGPTWITSGASIGDASTHDYVNATKTASITFAGTGESLTATSTSGAPDAIHVYRVDAAPANATGIAGLGDNNKYFGVFQVGGTAPQYTAVYFYSNIPLFPDETVVRLFKRSGNDAASWVNSSATQDQGANTMTVTGESTEYILGATGYSLPVTFGSFSASRARNGVQLSWSTVTEVNNSGFVIQHSGNGAQWTDLTFIAGAGNSATEKRYGYLHTSPVKGSNYYRIKQVDIDGRPTLSETRFVNVVNKAGITVYPVPASNSVTIDINKEGLLNTEARLIDVQGKVMKRIIISNVQETVSLEDLIRGVYYLQFADGTVHQVVKQ